MRGACGAKVGSPMREATAVLAATIVLLGAPAQAEVLEFDATLSIESLETLFPPAPG